MYLVIPQPTVKFMCRCMMTHLMVLSWLRYHLLMHVLAVVLAVVLAELRKRYGGNQWVVLLLSRC